VINRPFGSYHLSNTSERLRAVAKSATSQKRQIVAVRPTYAVFDESPGAVAPSTLTQKSSPDVADYFSAKRTINIVVPDP
jgi:hypothetical protein